MIKKLSRLFIHAVLCTVLLLGTLLAGEINPSLLPGLWSSPRHDYVYRENGTWEMLPKIKGGTNGLWKIRGNKLIITNHEFNSKKWATPEAFTITTLTRNELVYSSGKVLFSMKREK